MNSDELEVTRLEAEARYARERLELYRARSYSSKATRPTRLRELERNSARAAIRLRRARTQPDSN